MKTVFYVTLFSLTAGQLFAASVKESGGDACHTLEKACRKAGFERASEADVWKKCINPLLNGQHVPGVSEATDTINACKAKLSSRRR
jgi:hypothetical protein